MFCSDQIDIFLHYGSLFQEDRVYKINLFKKHVTMSQAWVKEKKSKSSRRNEVRDLLMRIVDKVNLMVVESKNFSIILHYSVLK